MRNALLNQNAVENEAWGMGQSDRLGEKPAAASLTWVLTGLQKVLALRGELGLYSAWRVILLWGNLASTR